MNNNILKKMRNNSRGFFLFILLYRLSLDIVYYIGIVPYFAYQGFVMDFSIVRLAISYLVILIIFPLIQVSNSGMRPSNYIVLLFNYLYFLPGCTYYAFAGISNVYFVYFCLFWFLLMGMHYYIKKIKLIPFIKRGNVQWFNLCIAFTAVFVIYVTVFYNNFEIKFDLKNVYEIRSRVSSITLPTTISYLLNPAAIIIPIAIVRFLQKQKYVWVCLLIILQLALFAFGALKFVLFILVVSLLLYFFYDKKLKRILPLGFASLNLFGIFQTYIKGHESVIVDYIQRRVLFVPNMLSYEYFNFFSLNEIDYLRQSFLRHLGFSSPYTIPIPKVIGYTVFGTNTHANTGLIGDAVSNLGWLGVIVYPFLFVSFFYFFDLCTKSISEKIIIISAVILSIKFIGGTFFSILLSGGGFLLCVLLIIYPRDELDKSKKILWF